MQTHRAPTALGKEHRSRSDRPIARSMTSPIAPSIAPPSARPRACPMTTATTFTTAVVTSAAWVGLTASTHAGSSARLSERPITARSLCPTTTRRVAARSLAIAALSSSAMTVVIGGVKYSARAAPTAGRIAAVIASPTACMGPRVTMALGASMGASMGAPNDASWQALVSACFSAHVCPCGRAPRRATTTHILQTRVLACTCADGLKRSHARVASHSPAYIPTCRQPSLTESTDACMTAKAHGCMLTGVPEAVGEYVAQERRAPLTADVGAETRAPSRAGPPGYRGARASGCRYERQPACPRGVRRVLLRVSLQPEPGARTPRWTGPRIGAARDLLARDERRSNVADRRSRWDGPTR